MIVLADIIANHHSIEDFILDGGAQGLDALQEFIDAFDLSDPDQTIDFDGNEYRIIRDSDIWDIYRDAIQSIVEDCYSDVINLDKVPNFIAVSIDWEQTAKNAYADGYGHTFSSYDHSEIETANHSIFRTN